MHLNVEFRHLSAYLQPPLQVELARSVSVARQFGERQRRDGFGVPLALRTSRCAHEPLCKLLPPEGIFRNATAWVEVDVNQSQVTPTLVLADPLTADALSIGKHRIALAMDTSAAYASGARTSKLGRLGIWGLLGGHEVGRRAGLYLLEDYDPNKRPLVMIHGLGSSPLAWEKLTNAVWGNPALRSRFQVWHVVYQTNGPLLVTRARVQGYLDEAWRILDPEGDDPARSGMVLVGHSLGGVVSRMLCVDSEQVLWNAAFLAGPESMVGEAADIEAVKRLFIFKPYPGVTRAIFLAAPHRGSPGADAWFGRMMRALVGRRAPEVQFLRRFAQDNSALVKEELRDTYQQADLNSISTLRASQPVRRAGETLMPVPSIPYHVISGVLPGRVPETDGAVPLSSTLLPAAVSTLIINSGHNLYENDQAVEEVVRILESDE